MQYRDVGHQKDGDLSKVCCCAVSRLKITASTSRTTPRASFVENCRKATTTLPRRTDGTYSLARCKSLLRHRGLKFRLH